MADANQVDGNWSCSLFRQWLIPPAGRMLWCRLNGLDGGAQVHHNPGLK